FILAAWCFSRSSPRLERWVLGLRGIGPMIADHRAGLGMPRRSKVTALTMMAVAVNFSAWIVLDTWLARIVVISLGAVGAAYVTFRVPTRERVLAARDVK
ncbi:MAG: YbaN family protein, partial [Acidimicrobiales bacterium]